MKKLFITILLISITSLVFSNQNKTIYEIVLKDGRSYVGSFVKSETIDDVKYFVVMDSKGQEYKIDMKDIKLQRELGENLPYQAVSKGPSQQSSDIAISFNLGKSFIYTNEIVSYSEQDDFYYSGYFLSSPFVPTVLSSSLYLNLSSGISFKMTGGFGFAKNTIEYDQPKKTFTDPDGDQITVNKEYSKDTYKLGGFNLEAAMTYPVAIDKNNKFFVYPGIGLGYYHYGMSGEWEREETYYDWYGNLIKSDENGDYEESKISGLAQTFILGFDFRLNETMSLNLEFAKLGFHLLKVTQDEDYTDGDFRKTIGENKSTQESYPGLIDVGVTFGVKINL